MYHMVRRIIESLLVDVRDAILLVAPSLKNTFTAIATVLRNDITQMLAIFAVLYLVMVLL
jgi:hypothetical protein